MQYKSPGPPALQFEQARTSVMGNVEFKLKLSPPEDEAESRSGNPGSESEQHLHNAVNNTVKMKSKEPRGTRRSTTEGSSLHSSLLPSCSVDSGTESSQLSAPLWLHSLGYMKKAHSPSHGFFFAGSTFFSTLLVASEN